MFSHFHGHGGRFRHARRGRDGEGFGPGWGGGRHGGVLRDVGRAGTAFSDTCVSENAVDKIGRASATPS